MSNKKSYLTIIFWIIPVTWAGSFIAAKYVVIEMSPLESVFWRFLLSAGIMFPYLLVFRRFAHPDFTNSRFLRHMVIVVLTSGILYHIFFFWGLQYTSPTNAALIIALNPFFTAFGEIMVFRKYRTKRFYLGFIIAFSGAVWVILVQGGQITYPGFGELFCFISSLSWSVYTIAAKKTKDAVWDPLWIGCYNYLFTAILVAPFILYKLINSNLWSYSGNTWIGLWYMAIFPTAIGYTLYYVGVQKKGPAWAAIYIYLVPSFTANLDYLFFNAQFTVPMVAGTTMVVTGLLIGNIGLDQIGKWMRKNRDRS